MIIKLNWEKRDEYINGMFAHTQKKEGIYKRSTRDYKNCNDAYLTSFKKNILYMNWNSNY